MQKSQKLKKKQQQPTENQLIPVKKILTAVGSMEMFDRVLHVALTHSG